MHVVVIGAGAIGSALAAGIARSGGDVTLVARGARLAWLREHQLEVEHGGELWRGAVAACDWAGLERPADLAILCTKTGDLPDAIAALASHLAPGGVAVTLQNGVEAPGLAAEGLPGCGVIAGRVHGFFEMMGQRARHVGVPPSIALGGTNALGKAAEEAVRQVLDRAGFACALSDDIAIDLWRKLMLVASLGPVAAAMGVPAGQVCRTERGEALLGAAASEVAAVGRACGVALGPEDVARTLAFVRQFPAEATTSLQRDLAAGQPSEYDALVGAVIRLAARHGVAVPTFGRLDRQLRPA